MFESARLPATLSKEEFKEREAVLRTDLLDAQADLAEAGSRAILILVNGPDGAGKGDVMNRLYEWLDPRSLQTLTYGAPTDEERARPPGWKYWRDLPPRGRIAIVLGSWYHMVLIARAEGLISAEEFSDALENINRLETMFHEERVTVLKLWLQLDPEISRARLKKAMKGKGMSRPVVREWAAIDTKPERKRLVEAALEMARTTSTGETPWHVVPAADSRYRDIAVGELLLDQLRKATADDGTEKKAAPTKPTKAKGSPAASALPKPSILSGIDYTARISEQDYDEELDRQQERITRATTSKTFRDCGLVAVFEGNDAAGKGGAIRRVRQALDPRRFQVHSVAAPTDEERARPYLWRFWRHVPARGDAAIFDRSWYGRVLVERVEGFCAEEDWRRAYGEINDFEEHLSLAGYAVVKFWLAISSDEQLRRFKEREVVPHKRFKITEEDWRNREKWPLYEEAVTEMVDRTSTPYAPWTLISANDKRHARIEVLRTIADRLEDL